MNDNWEHLPLAKIADHRLGKMLDKRKNKGNLRRYLRNVNVRWFDFDLSDLKEMRFTEDEHSKYEVRKGDLIVCEGGYPGRAAIWDSDETLFFQKALHRIRFHEPERNTWFLYYLFYLDSSGSLKSHFTGAGIQHLTGQTLAKLAVPLPPLQEQKRIVAILDEAFGAIAKAKENAEKNIANARELFENRSSRLLSPKQDGWDQIPLGQACESVEYGTSSKSSRNGKVPVLRMGNIQNREIDWSDLVFTDSDEEIEKYELRNGDVLFNRTNSAEHVGKTCVYRGQRQAIFAGYLIRINYRREILNGEFLNYYLNGKYAREYGKSVMSRSVNQANINGTKLKGYQIPLPPVISQRGVVDQLDALWTEVVCVSEHYRKKCWALDELKQSLLRKAFSGQLTNKSPELELVG